MQEKRFGYYMKKTTSYALFILALTAVVMARSSSKDADIPAEKIDVDVSKTPLAPEHEKAFTKFYASFIESHSINDEGEFISGGSIDDGAAPRAIFLHYLARNSPELTLVLGRRCKTCLGNSKIWKKVNPDDTLSLAKVEVDCGDCPSSGLIETSVTYRFIYSSKTLPELPEKPRVTKLRNLIVKALGGDQQSQLEYAAMLEKGAVGVPRDEKLARELYAKAFVSGSSVALDGLIRVEDGLTGSERSSERFLYVLRLVQAKLNASQELRSTYEMKPDLLGVQAPISLGFIDAKIAEIQARTMYSYFKSGDLRIYHVGTKGIDAILRPLKAQMDKQPPVTARSKVESVLFSYALEPDVYSFGSERLGLVKQAAVSMDPVAYGILGDVCLRGLNGNPNPQAAAVFLSISKKIENAALTRLQLDKLESRYDTATCVEMLEEFEKTKAKGLANPYFIEAMLKLERSK
jgi:hypothetical protein